MAGKGKLRDVIFLNCGHLDQKENYKIISHIYIYVFKENKDLLKNYDVHFRGPY